MIEILRGRIRNAAWERDTYSFREWKAAEAKLAKAVEALHQISLGSQNSGTTKESLGREARTVLAELEKTE
jgi:hypothetical protein